MTSASELFYNRRSRFNRSNLDLGEESSVDRSVHGGNRRHLNSSRRDRGDLDGSTHSRVSSHRPSLRDRDEGGSSSSQSSVSANSDVNGGRLPSTRNGRLPGAVLLAKQRLLQTLRTMSISRNPRQSNRARNPGANHNEASGFEYDFRLVEAGDWETMISRDWSDRHLFTEMVVAGQKSKRPPGLSEEDMIHLQSEVFGICHDEEGECCICLERFLDREELKGLPCGHRFHSGCLYPWILTCGDCPYCRAPIITSSDEGPNV